MKTPEQFQTYKTPRIMLAAALGVGALTGCSVTAEHLDNTPLVNRFEYDYTGGTINGGVAGGTKWNCLADTAYDTQTEGAASAIPRVIDANTIVIRPAGSTDPKDELTLVKKDNEHPLQPVGAQSELILQSNECVTSKYED